VGLEALAILGERGVESARLRVLASERSAGSDVPYRGGSVRVAEIGPDSFRGVELALVCASAEVARRLAPVAAAAGAVVVDNSSAFRADPLVPLVIPEVNGGSLPRRGSRGVIIANPNCSTIILLAAVNPLRTAFGIERLVVATYQAVSGAGAAAMEELREQVLEVANGREAKPRVFKEPCAFNVFSHDSAMDVETGVNGEERKIIDETRRIWDDPRAAVSPTCIRVPVMRAHTEAIAVTLASPASEGEVFEVLRNGPGLEVVDDRSANAFPTPLKAAGRDKVLVGRVRRDPAEEPDALGRSRSFLLMACGDQLRKGAALNAVQIAEALA